MLYVALQICWVRECFDFHNNLCDVWVNTVLKVCTKIQEGEQLEIFYLKKGRI